MEHSIKREPCTFIDFFSQILVLSISGSLNLKDIIFSCSCYILWEPLTEPLSQPDTQSDSSVVNWCVYSLNSHWLSSCVSFLCFSCNCVLFVLSHFTPLPRSIMKSDWGFQYLLSSARIAKYQNLNLKDNFFCFFSYFVCVDYTLTVLDAIASLCLTPISRPFVHI